MFPPMNLSNHGCFVDVLSGVFGTILSHLERKMGEGAWKQVSTYKKTLYGSGVVWENMWVGPGCSYRGVLGVG